MHLYASMRGMTRDRDNKVHTHTHIYTSTSPLPENRKDVEIVGAEISVTCKFYTGAH